MTKASKVTPLMKQYNDIKSKYPDAILLFRVGDFYETFGNDAVVASKILGIVLTKRGAGSTSETELAGFPHHSIGNYLPKLVKSGYRVAICDQLEDPKLAKKIVKKAIDEKYDSDLLEKNVSEIVKILDIDSLLTIPISIPYMKAGMALSEEELLKILKIIFYIL